MTDQEYVNIILSYIEHSKEKKERRRQKNDFNWRMYQHLQNYEHKQPGQSREFIPRMALQLEQLVTTIASGLTAGNDDFFTVDDGREPDPLFNRHMIKILLGYELFNADIISVIAEMSKYMGLESCGTLKVGSLIHGVPRFKAERGNPVVEVQGVVQPKVKVKKDHFKMWKLFVDVIPFEDFDTDPTPNPGGRPLFEIHSVTRDLHDLIETAEDEGVYDMKVIESIQDEFVREEEERAKEQHKNEPEVGRLKYRKPVTVREFWGTMLDMGTGRAKEKNVVCAIANDKYLIRPPEKNPRWDGESPFVRAALIDIPKSVHGKAIMDAPAQMNKTYNELMSLLEDGAMNEANNITQLNVDGLEDRSQVSDRIPPGTTLLTNSSLPAGVPVLNTVSTGRVPRDSMAMLEVIRNHGDEAAFSNELRLGQLPAPGVKATSINRAEGALAGIFGGLLRILEDKAIVPLLEKCWLEILQNVRSEYFLNREVVALIGEEAANVLSQMSPEERFARGAFAGKVRVRGLSSFIARLREFQKLVQLLGIIGDSPQLMSEFQREYSMTKLLGEIVKNSGIREEAIIMTDEERQQRRREGQVQNLIQKAMGAMEGGNGGERPGPRRNPEAEAQVESTGPFAEEE